MFMIPEGWLQFCFSCRFLCGIYITHNSSSVLPQILVKAPVGLFVLTIVGRNHQPYHLRAGILLPLPYLIPNLDAQYPR